MTTRWIRRFCPEYPKAANPGAYLNEHLLGDLRPTLFLAQLSNLLAGNISIVHGVIGSSRTFMGEEASGADAVRIACARIAAGQGDIMLVGGSYNAQRPDVLLHYEMGGLLCRAALRPGLGASKVRRRHDARVGRLLPGDRRPSARGSAGSGGICPYRGDTHGPLPPPAGRSDLEREGAIRRDGGPF